MKTHLKFHIYANSFDEAMDELADVYGKYKSKYCNDDQQCAGEWILSYTSPALKMAIELEEKMMQESEV